MTEQEVLHFFKNCTGDFKCWCNDFNTKHEEIALEALEKQVAKKPDTKRPGYFATFGKCKSCGESITDYYKYCSQCGQKIDWEESK